MGDRLKQFIDENREAFDSATPSSKILRNIRKEVDPTAPKMYRASTLHWAAAIAGVIVLAATVYFTTRKNDKSNNNNITVQNYYNAPVTEPVYAKQIDKYEDLIGLQQNELRAVQKDQPELYKRFASDINQLDSAYRVLKATLATNPNRELLLEAMISNLQFQSELLNRQLSIIKEIKQKRTAHEKSNI